MNYNFIDTQNKLTKIFRFLQKEEYIGVDTEFERRRTFYPILSLIQISGSFGEVIIDFIKLKDISILKEIFVSDKIIKIFHDGRQDIEIFYNMFQSLPNNIYDTQIAAKYCGYGYSVGYSRLCKEICNVNLDKTLQSTNWTKRPLTNNMINYLVKEVKYLRKVYINLHTQIVHLNKMDLYNRDIEQRYNIDVFNLDIKESYNKINIPDNLGAKLLKKIKLLAFLREKSAMKYNLPRKNIINNQDLIRVAKTRSIKNINYIKKAFINILKKYNLIDIE